MGLYAVAELYDDRPVPDFTRPWVTIQPKLASGVTENARAVELVGMHGDVANEMERAGLLPHFRLPSAESGG